MNKEVQYCFKHHWAKDILAISNDARCGVCSIKYGYYLEFRNSERAKEEPEWFNENFRCHGHEHEKTPEELEKEYVSAEPDLKVNEA